MRVRNTCAAMANELMSRRIRRILLVCNNYDSYSLEEDGRVEAQISREYSELNLSNPPIFVRVESTIEALALLEKGERFDLAISMYNVGEVDVFEFSRRLKEYSSDMPVVLLTSFSRELYRKIDDNDTSSIDYIFCWNNSPDLLLAIIKLLEDSLNAEHDILEGGVQAILLVEDSVRYYSAYLPELYKLVLQQNVDSIKDALNESQQVVRKRSRPKILLARCYDDAELLFNRYKANILGVITDVGFVMHRGDKPSTEKLDAGVQLVNMIRSEDPKMPVLMQSSQESIRAVAKDLGVGFVVKKSRTLISEVGEYIGREFGFGDFIVVDPNTGAETARAHDLQGLEKLMNTMTDEEYYALAEKNYISKWLFARGLFSIARALRPLDRSNTADMRKISIKAIRDYRIAQAMGVVAKFDASTFNDTIRFAKFGEGSLGGKARGLSFLNHILQKYTLYDRWEDVHVLIPRTLAVATDLFDEFIRENGLGYVINSDLSDEEILSEFVSARLPGRLTEALKAFLLNVPGPLAIRSSSKLEDSYYQPFAGVYSTYMIPDASNLEQRFRMLARAIKSVYASVFYASSRAYITATANVISEEKMAVIIQEVCGSDEDGFFFPTLSGVARSVNFYPVGHEKAGEGIVKVAYGLGKAVVDGDQVLRFSPVYPKNVIQTSTPDLTMRDTQKAMYALSPNPGDFRVSTDDGVNLRRIDIADCGKFSSLSKVASTWDMENMRMVDSTAPKGPRFITFAHMLRYGSFPLAEICRKLLEITRKEMKCEVELEFAAQVNPNGESEFDVLQIRPISSDSLETRVDWDSIDTGNALLHSSSALGTGWIKGISDIVYLKKEAFDTLKTLDIAAEITSINAQMRSDGRQYALIGFGRWGSSIPSLGVPVKWSDISEARVIVECSLDNFRVDPSQGTHFFQNLTSFNAGYINVDPFSRADDLLDFSALDALPAVNETCFLRHVRLDRDLEVCIDGMKNRALIK
ncbi:MAG: phosphoenolpyruvate synthase [Bacteroidales bacterium]|nr:phosphoenolpyruvate synthase [Bacteroidales bacterium]